MLTIVMPAHNEELYIEAAVEAVVRGLRDHADPFEVILVENGSTDATASVVGRLSQGYPEIRPCTLPEADYGAALRAGFLAASGDVVVNFDVDLVDLDFLDRAVAKLADPELAMVVGSKRTAGAVDRRSMGRRVVTGVFSLMLRYAFGLRVSDTHGLKAMRRQPLVAIVEESRFGKDIFDTEVILRAQRAGLRIDEVPVVVSDVRPPRTPVVRRIPRAFLGLLKLRIALWRAAPRA